MPERMLFRVGAVSAMLGSMLFLVTTVFHPSQAEPNDPRAAFQEYAASTIWVAVHIGQFFGFLLVVGCLVVLARSIQPEQAAAWARLGTAAAVASTSVLAVLQAVDGIALKEMVDAWVSAPPAEKQSLFHATLAVRQIEIGLASFWAVLSGLTFLLFGLAVAMSEMYPKWLGGVAAVAGSGLTLGGLTVAYTGFSTLAMDLNMVSGLVVTLWMIGIGILMWRRA